MGKEGKEEKRDGKGKGKGTGKGTGTERGRRAAFAAFRRVSRWCTGWAGRAPGG